MKAHAVNFDAIREGGRAALRNYPHEPTWQPRIPSGVHRVLWEDDWWRGITMTTEACGRAFDAETAETKRRWSGGSSQLAELLSRHQATCRAVLGEQETRDEGVDLHEDELAVLSTLWSNLSASGDAERYGPGCPCDPDALNDTEPDADVREEA